MESNDLKIFARVVQLGSISRAAEALGYVQSNVTSRIKALEEELGTPLFTRTNRGVQLLPAGELLYEYTQKILALMNEAVSVISSGNQGLRVGATPAITTGYLSKLMMADSANLSVYTRPADELISLLIQNELDCILLNRSVKHREIKSIISHEETIGWLTNGDDIGIDDVSRLPILVSRDQDCPYRLATLDFLKRYEIKNYSLVEYDIIEPILIRIENGSGIAVLPKRLMSEKMACASAISSDLPPVKIHCYMKTEGTEISPGIQEFIHRIFSEYL